MKVIIEGIEKSFDKSRTYNDFVWISLKNKNYGFELDRVDFEKLDLNIGDEVDESILEELSTIAF